MKKHRLNIFPEMVEQDFNLLKSDIQLNGFDNKQPIYLYEGDILDGWNRQRVCNELKVIPTYIDFNGTEIEAINFVMRTNKRRNLTSSQWAAIAVNSDELIKTIKESIEKERYIKSGNTFKNNLGRINSPKEVDDFFDFVGETNKPIKSAKVIGDIFNTNSKYINEADRIKKTNPDAFKDILSGKKTITEVKKEELQQKAAILKAEQIELSKNTPTINNIILGNSIEETLNAPNNIKCVLTDPPYGMAFVSNRRTATAKDDGIKNDDTIEMAIDITKQVYSNLYSKMADDSVLFSFIGWKQERFFMDMIEEVGFTIKNSIIWVKNNHGSGDLTGSFSPKHERIIFAVKGSPKLNFRPEDVLNGSEIVTEHPTSKPIDLLEILIKATTNEGDIVVDPFAGQGSTAIAASRLKRNFWVCELDEYNHSQINKNILTYGS